MSLIFDVISFFRRRRPSLRRENLRLLDELAARDVVIQALCYRYLIRNHTDAGWGRASIAAEQITAQGRRGTLNLVDVPPSQRLLLASEKAYYGLPGRVSMASMNNKPLPAKVLTDDARAAQIVVENYTTSVAN
jgi:hypothetical protein